MHFFLFELTMLVLVSISSFRLFLSANFQKEPKSLYIFMPKFLNKLLSLLNLIVSLEAHFDRENMPSCIWLVILRLVTSHLIEEMQWSYL